MSQQLLDLAQRAMELAKKVGAQGTRASAYRSRRNTVEWRDGKLDRLREHTRMGLTLTLYVDGRYSSHTTSDLRPAVLQSFVERAVAMTRVLTRDPHRKLPDPERYRERHEGDLRLFDGKSAEALTPDERRRMAAALEQAARSGPGKDKVISANGVFSDSAGERALVTSNGMSGTSQGTYFTEVAWLSVKDKGDRKPSGSWWETRRWRSDLPSVEQVGQEAMRRALMCLGEKPEKSGRYPCIIENAVVGRLLWGLLGPLQGNAIQQRRSFLADQLGKRIATPLLTIVDDPLRPAGLDSKPFDDEGMSTARRPIVERGVLRSFFLDTYYASKLGKKATTGGSTNVVFTPGKRDLAGLLRAMRRGILITGFSGGNFNSATGDFSIGIRGQWIENGVVVRPVAEMNLAGNHLQLWKQLAELGNDLRHSDIVAPSLRFKPLQFSGV
jgi:PmbA protein